MKTYAATWIVFALSILLHCVTSSAVAQTTTSEAPKPSAEPPSPAVKSAVKWRSDYDRACREAKDRKLPLFLFFSTENSFFSKMQEAEFAKDPALVDLLSSKFVPVQIGSDSVGGLIELFSISAFPTLLVVNAEGKTVRQMVGLRESSNLMAMLPSLAGAADTQEIGDNGELAWAKGIVEDFIEQASHSDWKKGANLTAGLLSPELAKAFKEDNSWNILSVIPYNGYRHPKFTSEKLAPNGSEAIFSGRLTGKDGREATFRFRVARESEKGKWSIRLVVLEELPEEKKKP